MGEGKARSGTLKVQLSRTAEKQLHQLPMQLQRRVAARIEQLSTAPHSTGTKKLTGSDASFRARVGDYRILYEVEPGVLFIASIEHRSTVYR
ncbi:MAG: type II toxin-antitoxin system RelE/ParE family toxin [Bryobacterales bacterium]|nr:type II toxin-antitoxin system RelE/ParE family toxin [Bryobacterales bacterium]